MTVALGHRRNDCRKAEGFVFILGQVRSATLTSRRLCRFCRRCTLRLPYWTAAWSTDPGSESLGWPAAFAHSLFPAQPLHRPPYRFGRVFLLHLPGEYFQRAAPEEPPPFPGRRSNR